MTIALGVLLGAIVGSFIATLILRWPNERSVISGRSACDGCGRMLRAAELVPLLSLLWTRGRCRSCSAPIDPLHWQVELASAAVGGGAMALNPGPEGAALAILGWLLLPLAILDWRHHWLPDRLNLTLAIIGLAIGGAATGVALENRLIGGIAGFVVLALIGLAYRRIRKREGLGGGDPKLLGALGCWVGWQALPPLLLIAAGSSLALIYASRSSHDPFKTYPLGTALAASGAVVAVALNQLA